MTPLTEQQLADLREGDSVTADIVTTMHAMCSRIVELDARVKKLEAEARDAGR